MRTITSVFGGMLVALIYSVLFNFDISTASILMIGWANLFYQSMDK